MRNELHFHGPFTLIAEGPDNLFKQKSAKQGGVYLWTFKGEDGYVIDYVGEASHVQGRFVEHLQEQLNGRYSIYDPEKLKEGIRELQWQGYLWRKDEYLRVLDFIRDGENHMQLLQRMLAECRVFYAPIEATSRIRKRIESGILNNIMKMEFYTRSLQNPPQNRLILQYIETPMEIRVSADEVITGLGNLITF